MSSPNIDVRELLLLCGMLFAAGIVVITWYPVNHDTAWLLHVATRWLDGARLYVDVIEVNPPLVIMLLVPVVAIAELFSVWDVSVFYIAVLCIAALSLWLSRRILMVVMPHSGVPFLIVSLAAIYLFLPRAEFGQREHLMLMLAAPYFFTIAARSMGAALPQNQAAAAGVLGGIGLALKPHFLLALVASEAYLAFTQRRWSARRGELIAILAVGIVYGIALLTFTPAYFGVARWAIHVYGHFFPSTWQSIALQPGTVYVTATVAAAWFTRKWGLARLRHTFAIVAVVFALIVFIQNKNWDYHWLPVYSAAGLVWASLLIEGIGTRMHSSALRRGVLWFVSAGMIVAGLMGGYRASSYEWLRLERVYRFSSIVSIINETNAREWFTLSSSMPTAFPIVTYTGVTWTARFNFLWPLVAFYEATPPFTREFPYHSRDEMGDLERYVFDATLQDLFRSRPSLLLVDGHPPGGTLHGFDYLRYFAADARFIDFMRNYELIADLGPFRIYSRLE